LLGFTVCASVIHLSFPSDFKGNFLLELARCRSSYG